MLCSAKRASLILCEDNLCFLAERPTVCPLFSNLPLAGEDFLAWFLRRFSSDSDATAGRTLRLEGWELILVSQAGCAPPFPLSLPIAKAKRFAGTASESPDASGWEVDKISSPDGWRVSHPWLESALFVSVKPFPEGEKRYPSWLDSSQTNAYRCARLALEAKDFCACRFLSPLDCPSNSLAPSKLPFGKRDAKSENVSSLPKLGTSAGPRGKRFFENLVV